MLAKIKITGRSDIVLGHVVKNGVTPDVMAGYVARKRREQVFWPEKPQRTGKCAGFQWGMGKKKPHHSMRLLKEYGSYLLSRIVVQYHRP
jgi:hypothetical protein